MDIHASAKFVKVAPRKVRLVVDAIRGKSVEYARHQLQFTHKAAAKPLLRLIESAVANAKNNFELENTELYIKSIIANEGPTLKRYMPRAYGKADVIRKKMTHVHLILAEKIAGKKKQTGKKKTEDAKKEKPSAKKTASTKSVSKKKEPVKKSSK